MAVGADISRPQQAASRGKPAVQQQASPASLGALMVNDSAVADVANNQRAAGAGAGFAALRGMDRPGVSRGKGQQHLADIAEVEGIETGNAAANATESGAANANRDAVLGYRNAMANERLTNQGLLEQLRSNRASERLAHQGYGQNLNEAMRRGQLQLDSMYLNYAPLLSRLIS